MNLLSLHFVPGVAMILLFTFTMNGSTEQEI